MLNNNYYSSLLKLLNKHKVSYVIVKDKASIAGDLHIWSEATPENKLRLINVLEESEIDALMMALSASDNESAVKLPEGQLKIQILNSIEGYSFQDAFQESEEVSWGEEIKVKAIPAIKDVKEL